MGLRFLLAAFVVSISLTGCGGAGQPVSPVLALRVVAPARVPLGERVVLRLVLRNASATPVEVQLNGRPAHDAVVRRPDGTEVWRWSHGQTIQDILQVSMLQPSEELAFEAVWPQRDNNGRPVTPGAYRLQGLVRLDRGSLASSEISLIVLP